MKLLSSLLALGVVAMPVGAVEAERSSVKVVVDTNTPGPTINREIYGQFIEHIGTQIYDGIWVGERSTIPNIHGYRKDVVDALKKLHVPVLRWPGGCFADQYNWRDGIGPRATRPVRLNSHYGGTIETNAFGTHEFLDFAELIGAEPYVSINVGSMTPLEASQWIEYMTSDKKSSLAEERRRNGRHRPWKLKYIGVGNELWGCGGNMRPEFAADMTRRYSAFLNTSTEHDLFKVASGPTANLSEDSKERFADAMMEGKTAFGVLPFEALSLHYYVFPGIPDVSVANAHDQEKTQNTALGFSESEWAEVLLGALRMEQAIASVSTLMDKYDPERKVALCVDEWGAWHDSEPNVNPRSLYQQSSLLDAEVAALTLNIFHKHTDRVKLASNSEMVNAIQAIMLTRGEKTILTPVYHVFDMYQPFQGALPYPTTVSGAKYRFGEDTLPAVDASAAKGRDGNVWLAAVNLDPHHAADVATNLTGAISGLILTGPALDTHNTFEAPNTIHPEPFHASNGTNGVVAFTLPAKSIVVIKVQGVSN